MEEKVIKVEETGITTGTIARTVCLALALINQVLAMFGHGTLDIADDMVYQLVTILFTIGTAVIAWWKNNSFTREARTTDNVMKKLKKENNI